MADLVEQLSGFAGGREHHLIEADETPINQRGRPPTELELAEDYAAPGEPALLPVGISFQGDWKVHSDGIARHTRELASALAKVGLPTWIHMIADTRMLDGELHPDVVNKCGHLRRTSIGQPVIGIRHAIIHNSEFLLNLVAPKGVRVMEMAVQKRVYDSTVLYTSWERSTVHPAVVEILNRCGQVWVPCNRNREVFIANGVIADKVHVVPCPYDTSSEVCKIAWPRGSQAFGYHVMETDSQGKPKPVWKPVNGKRFYAIGKWESRKNYDWLLGAFLLAFTPKDRASLVIKTGDWFAAENYPSRSQSSKKWLDDPRVKANGWTLENSKARIRIITAKLSDAHLADIHRRNNIYVSCSHGEAWDLPAFDAKCAGNRLVHVGYGGSEDYAGADDVSVPWKLGPVDPAYGWEKHAEWAHYEFDDLVSALRAAEPPAKRIHPTEFYRRFGNIPVALRVKDLLKAMVTTDVWSQIEDAGGFG